MSAQGRLVEFHCRLHELVHPRVNDAGAPPSPDRPVRSSLSDGDGFPRELYAPAVEGPIILPRSKPRIVRGEHS